MNTDISLEPLFNRGGSLTGQGALVTSVAEVGACSNRTALTITDVAQEITIGALKNSMEIINTGSNSIYFGGSGVTSANGMVLEVDMIKTFNKVKPTFSLWVICATGLTSILRIVEYA